MQSDTLPASCHAAEPAAHAARPPAEAAVAPRPRSMEQQGAAPRTTPPPKHVF